MKDPTRIFQLCKVIPPFRLIDMFVEEPLRFSDVEQKALRVKYGSVKVPIMAIEHLIKLKKIAGRGKDLEDIVQLRAIQERCDEESRENQKRSRKA